MYFLIKLILKKVKAKTNFLKFAFRREKNKKRTKKDT